MRKSSTAPATISVAGGFRADTAAGQNPQRFPQHRKAQPPQNDRHADNDIDARVLPVAHEIIRLQGKARVAEGRYGVKQRLEGRKEGRIAAIQQHGGQQFDARGNGNDLADEAAQVEGIAQQGLTDRLPAGKGHSPTPEQKNQTGIRHDAQPAGLDQTQQNPLPQRRKDAADVNGGKSRHADGGRGDKKSVYPGQVLPRHDACGQPQGARAQQDDDKEGIDGPGKRAENAVLLHGPCCRPIRRGMQILRALQEGKGLLRFLPLNAIRPQSVYCAGDACKAGGAGPGAVSISGTHSGGTAESGQRAQTPRT